MTTDSPGKRRKQERALRGHPYEIAKVAAFRRTRENWGGLSNMASGFPLWIGPIRVPSSEALYQACRFPDLPSCSIESFAEERDECKNGT